MTNLQAIDLLKGLEQSLDDYCELNDEGKTAFGMAITALELFGNSEQLPSAQPEQRWIPFKTRPLTKEEKEEHPEWDGILDCKLPDDGQRILVNVSVRGHESVQYDEFYTDDGNYLDSGYEIGTEATAWMPLPEPYMGTRSDTSDRRKD